MGRGALVARRIPGEIALFERIRGEAKGELERTLGSRLHVDRLSLEEAWAAASQRQNQYLAESSALAESVQRHLNTLTGTRNRGIRQAPFRVLMGATMPAILVEVGFISNPDEEALFRDPDYVDNVVRALTDAVRAFLEQIRDMTRGGPR